MNKELFIIAPTKKSYDNNEIDPEAIVFIKEEGEQSIIVDEDRYRGLPKNRESGQILRGNSGKLSFRYDNIHMSNEFGEIVLYDKYTRGLVSCSSTSQIQNPAQYVPIGIVVIPSSHDVYGTGECGVVSLVNMSLSNPSSGSAIVVGSDNLLWGSYGDIPGLDYYTRVPNYKFDGVEQDELQTPQVSTSIPTDSSEGTINCIHVPGLKYVKDILGFGPCPYNIDGSRNPIYSIKEFNNALSDFDGKGNTKKIIDFRGGKNYSTWKPTTLTDFPAASCCDMFYTAGTQSGDWYLPAVGETGYILTNINKITTIQTNINAIYSGSVCAWNSTSAYNTSTKATDQKSWHYHMSGKYIGNTYQNNYVLCTRAFMRGLFPKII